MGVVRERRECLPLSTPRGCEGRVLMHYSLCVRTLLHAHHLSFCILALGVATKMSHGDSEDIFSSLSQSHGVLMSHEKDSLKIALGKHGSLSPSTTVCFTWFREHISTFIMCRLVWFICCISFWGDFIFHISSSHLHGSLLQETHGDCGGIVHPLVGWLKVIEWFPILTWHDVVLRFRRAIFHTSDTFPLYIIFSFYLRDPGSLCL